MTPTFRIVVQGQGDITAAIADRLLSLEVTDKAGVKSDRLSITIDDRDQRIEIPKRGAKLEVSIGYVGRALVRLGVYTVDEVSISGPVRTMSISANAVDMQSGIKSPKERSFDGITFGALVRTVAGDNGLQASIPSGLASRDLGHVDQTESDLQLLTRICTEQGATFKVADGRLVVADRAAGKTASGGDLPAAVIAADQCASWSAALTERERYKSVAAYYQNFGAGRRRKVTAGSGRPERQLKKTYANADEARRAADSNLKTLARGACKVSIRGLVGDPTMAAEMIATLSGFRAGVDGSDWVIDEVTHRLSNDGYTCDIELEAKA